MRNNIVTRGMGTHQLLVTRGYGGAFVERIVEVVRRITINLKGRRHVDEWDEVTVFARMIEYDDKEPAKPIAGRVTVRLKRGDRPRAIASIISKKIKEIAVSALRIIK